MLRIPALLPPFAAALLAAALPAQTAASPSTLPELMLAPVYPEIEFERPIFATQRTAGGPVYVVQQTGRILAVADDPSATETAVFLDLSEKVRTTHNEEGLLSFAFHTQFEDNGQVFVNYSASDPRRSVISRFHATPGAAGKADPASEEVILELMQPYGNHNGCTLLFGPDGYLYASFGDGGWANDPLDSGQDLSTLLGTILRIDVDHQQDGRNYAIPADNPFVGREGARGEIWAYGLRNVWRMSFDRATGELWAGDVGQDKFEEIDLVVKGGNYGWRVREGTHPFKEGQEPVGVPLEPVVEYPHALGLSVTGGYVYRGRDLPELAGAYLYADYLSRRIWAVRAKDGVAVENVQVLAPSNSTYVASFGETFAGELLICGFDVADRKTGRLYRLAKSE
ncbi:MAG TPA: PQQ-dependent sugar dehydrogenase [Planctomycetota bacterium]